MRKILLGVGILVTALAVGLFTNASIVRAITKAFQLLHNATTWHQLWA